MGVFFPPTRFYCFCCCCFLLEAHKKKFRGKNFKNEVFYTKAPVDPRRLESHKLSNFCLSVQQYKTLTYRRNLNDCVTNRTHLPMKLSSDKAVRADLCVDLCTQITCARSISDLAIMSRATDKRLYTEGSTPKKTSSFARTLQKDNFPLRKLSFFVIKTTLSSIKKKRSPQIRASSPATD